MHDIGGLHHVTCVAGDPQQNLEFYVGVLGLRCIKTTVDPENPANYHLYYGDDIGSPGTVCSFLCSPGAVSCSPGTGSVSSFAFSVGPTAIAFWQCRFKSLDVRHEQPFKRFDAEVLPFFDRDGTRLELVGEKSAESSALIAASGEIPGDYAITGIHSVTLCEDSFGDTAFFMSGVLRASLVNGVGKRFRFAIGGKGPGGLVDVVCLPGEKRCIPGKGCVEQVAFMCRDEEALEEWYRVVRRQGLSPRDIQDEKYFHSFTFEEPGGVRFKICTQRPGFTVDQDSVDLGTGLCLPAFLEPRRTEITGMLARLHYPVRGCPGTSALP